MVHLPSYLFFVLVHTNKEVFKMGKIQYSNRISLNYILDNEITEILSEAITSMSIIHNYDTANMPNEPGSKDSE